MKNQWEIIHEADDDDGNPTNWALEINHKKYGKYVWISGYDNIFDVEVDNNPEPGEMTVLVTCTSLRSAKRWVTMNLM